ncbi:MAG: 50S ribosomal protein L32 [Candidatus Omnitrophota bacterium]
MALPNRRFSRCRTRKMRTHKKAKAAQLSVCPQCKQAKLAHRICTVCGYYKGREVIKIKPKEKKEEKGK